MNQQIPVIYHDKNYLENLLRTNLIFKGKDARYNFNSRQLKKILEDNEGYNITTQLANLYATATKSNNNITIINKMNDETNNEDLLKQIEELKKENKQLKKENEELNSNWAKKRDEDGDEYRKIINEKKEENQISKKKYDKMIELKNKYYKEMNEYKNELVVIKEKNETLQYELDELKKKYNIEEQKPYDPFSEEYSDEEEDEDTYKKIEETEEKDKEEKEEEFDIHKLDTKGKIDFLKNN